MLPKLHLDADYPCDLVGNWNTWYGEQDQAGERILHEDRAREGGTQSLPRHPPPRPDPDAGQGEDAGRALVSQGGALWGSCCLSPHPTPLCSPPSAPLALFGGVPGPDGLHEQAEAEQGSARTGSAPPSRGPPRAAPAGGSSCPGSGCPQEYLDFRKERSRMLLSRRNQLLLEFSFWNEPLPRQGPNIYELRTYKLKVRPPL